MALFNQSVSAQIQINAPIEQVWAVLADLEHYQDWNPFTYKVKSNLTVGDEVVLHVNLGPKQRVVQKQTIRQCQAPSALDWGMVMAHPTLLKTLRTQRLTKLDASTTLYETRDQFSGLLTPLILSIYRGPIRHGFESICTSLQARCSQPNDSTGH